jgi:enoyl-CoA hydratase
VRQQLEIVPEESAIHLRFVRPEKRNALDSQTAAELRAALDDFAHADRPLVLRSASPGMFVAGADVNELRRRTVDQTLARTNARLFQQLADHPMPTIAVVEGWALGGGFELALACDIRITTPDAQWGLPEVRLGIIPSGGALSRTRELIGSSRATDLVLTGRRIDGAEAHRIGLAQRVAEAPELDQALTDLLHDFGAAPARTLGLAKEAMRVDGDRHRLVDAAAQAMCLAEEETQRRLAALVGGQPGPPDPG